MYLQKLLQLLLSSLVSMTFVLSSAYAAEPLNCSVEEPAFLIQGGNRPCGFQSSVKGKIKNNGKVGYALCGVKLINKLKSEFSTEIIHVGGPVARCVGKEKNKYPKSIKGKRRVEWYKVTNGTCQTKNWSNKKALSLLTEDQKRRYNHEVSKHSSGRALDFFVQWEQKSKPTGDVKNAGDKIKNWALKAVNRKDYGISEVIWNEVFYSKNNSWKGRAYPSRPHYDHVHLSCNKIDDASEKKEVLDELASSCKAYQRNNKGCPNYSKKVRNQIKAKTKNNRTEKKKALKLDNATKLTKKAKPISKPKTDKKPVVKNTNTSNSSVQSSKTPTDLGHICFDLGNKQYKQEVQNDSAIWLARMIDGETAGHPTKVDANYMIWSSVQRWYLRGGFRKGKVANKSLTEVTRNHSQPVNVIWRKNGKKCSRFYKSGKYVKNNTDRAKLCKPNIVNRRAKYQALKWSEISPVARNAVTTFFDGNLKNPIAGAVGWAANGLWNRQQKSGNNVKEKKYKVASASKNTYYRLTRPKGKHLSSKETQITVMKPGSTFECGNDNNQELVKKPKKIINKKHKPKNVERDGVDNPFKKKKTN